MDAGVPLEDCLEKYPEFSLDLKQLLDTAQVINELRVENIPSNAMEQSRIKLLSLARDYVLNKMNLGMVYRAGS
jgi:hypothetical protein